MLVREKGGEVIVQRVGQKNEGGKMGNIDGVMKSWMNWEKERIREI